MLDLTNPVVRLYVVVHLLLVLKIAAVGTYTSVLRIGRKVFATPEDYRLQGMAPRATVDEDIERVRRAHQNDLENILPFFVVGLCFLLTRPSLGAAAIYLIGFLVARTLHTFFYIRGRQPHRTIAFTLGGIFTFAMLVHTLVAVLRA